MDLGLPQARLGASISKELTLALVGRQDFARRRHVHGSAQRARLRSRQWTFASSSVSAAWLALRLGVPDQLRRRLRCRRNAPPLGQLVTRARRAPRWCLSQDEAESAGAPKRGQGRCGRAAATRCPPRRRLTPRRIARRAAAGREPARRRRRPTLPALARPLGYRSAAPTGLRCCAGRCAPRLGHLAHRTVSSACAARETCSLNFILPRPGSRSPSSRS